MASFRVFSISVLVVVLTVMTVPASVYGQKGVCEDGGDECDPTKGSVFTEAFDRVSGLVLLVGTLGVVVCCRVNMQNVLDSKLRLRLLEMAGSRPGIDTTRLATDLGVTVSTVLYHGRILASSGHVRLKRCGGRVMFFAADKRDGPLKLELVSAMRRAGKAQLLELLTRTPGVHVSAAARLLGLNRSTVKRHTDELVSAGIVEESRDGRMRVLVLTPAVRSLLDRDSVGWSEEADVHFERLRMDNGALHAVERTIKDG